MQWLEHHKKQLMAAVEGGRRSHAYLISGPAGVGKRMLALWFGRRLLGLPEADGAFVNADASFVAPESGKNRISVEQIRALSADLALSSHHGGVKLAIVEPADAMTVNAANALLKTLEEPAGDSCLLLVADGLQYVPATVLSRCIHIKVACPGAEPALDWLREQASGEDAEAALELAGGAPVKALNMLNDGTVDIAAQLQTGFVGLLSNEVDPVTLAAAWKKIEPPQVFSWLGQVTDALIRFRLTGERNGRLAQAVVVNVPANVDTKNLFCYLDRLNRIRGQAKGTYNEQLALESLLLAWTTDLVPAEFDAPLMLAAT